MSSVDHPEHYNSHPSGVEAIEIAERLSFNLGNAIKYLLRRKHKGHELEDLQKALWYAKREHERLSKSPRDTWPGSGALFEKVINVVATEDCPDMATAIGLLALANWCDASSRLVVLAADLIEEEIQELSK
jgi:hypothetical protein